MEPESDLAFAGGCASLALSRMYNSFNLEGGAFGPGWSSWTEVRARARRRGRRSSRCPTAGSSQFPRLGDGWDRAVGESMWLTRDEDADELRVTDNDGGTWRFTRTGRPALARPR